MLVSGVGHHVKWCDAERDLTERRRAAQFITDTEALRPAPLFPSERIILWWKEVASVGLNKSPFGKYREIEFSYNAQNSALVYSVAYILALLCN